MQTLILIGCRNSNNCKLSVTKIWLVNYKYILEQNRKLDCLLVCLRLSFSPELYIISYQ